MKTSHLIAVTATIVACTAATASARPAVEPPGGHASKPQAATPASIAAHREQIAGEQWQRRQAQPEPAPATDRATPGDGVPLGLVLVGGMAIGTLFTLFVVPVAYILISKRARTAVRPAPELQPASASAAQ